MKLILRAIRVVLVSIVGLGAFIFGIIWGCSLLVNELQSPGSVSLSATILYIFLFHVITENVFYLIKEELKETKEAIEAYWKANEP